MKRFGRGPLLIAVGVLLVAIGLGLYDGWRPYFLCPMCLGVGCVVAGPVTFFFTALTRAAERDHDAGEPPT